MAYKIRIILDVEDDIIRDILIDGNSDLETLHFCIAKSFGFGGKEMASFYKTDDEWIQGEEIPLFDMSETGESFAMNTFNVNEILSGNNTKLIYVYDFLKMWTFFVEVLESNITESVASPKICFSLGEVPEKAPEKTFLADDDGFSNNEDDYSDYGDNLSDDYDLDNLY